MSRKDFSAYHPAEEVAKVFEDFAGDLRRRGGLVRHSIQVWFLMPAEERAELARRATEKKGD